MKIQAVIFDLDGVILNSCTEGMEGIIKMVEASGFTIPPNIRSTLKDNWGKTPAKALEISFGLDPQTSREISKRWGELSPLPLVAGAENVLSTLKFIKKMKLGLLTSRDWTSLFPILKHHLLIRFFGSCIQCENDFPHIKPDPRVFDYILELLGVSRDGCIYIGDTPIDFAAAHDKGIENISVLTGVNEKNDFLAIGQKEENVINSIADLPEWIEKYRT